MYNGGQWHGFGKEESTELFRELVENTPQIPIDKMVYQVKLMKKRLNKYISHLADRRRTPMRPVLNDDLQETVFSESNC